MMTNEKPGCIFLQRAYSRRRATSFIFTLPIFVASSIFASLILDGLNPYTILGNLAFSFYAAIIFSAGGLLFHNVYPYLFCCTATYFGAGIYLLVRNAKNINLTINTPEGHAYIDGEITSIGMKTAIFTQVSLSLCFVGTMIIFWFGYDKLARRCSVAKDEREQSAS